MLFESSRTSTGATLQTLVATYTQSIGHMHRAAVICRLHLSVRVYMRAVDMNSSNSNPASGKRAFSCRTG